MRRERERESHSKSMSNRFQSFFCHQYSTFSFDQILSFFQTSNLSIQIFKPFFSLSLSCFLIRTSPLHIIFTYISTCYNQTISTHHMTHLYNMAENLAMRPPTSTLNIFPSQPMHIEPPSSSSTPNVNNIISLCIANFSWFLFLINLI